MTSRAKQFQRNRGAKGFSRGLLCGASLAAVLASGVPATVHAADRYWDANATAVGSGGTGVWNLGNLNWSPNGDGVSGPFVFPWDNGALDNAIFGGTTGTVTLGTAITAHNLTFSTNAYVLTGSTLTLGGITPTITVTTGTSQIESIVAGTSGFTKAGGGALQFLNTANTFSGGISLVAGSLYAATDGAFGAASNNITTATGADVTLRIDGANTARSITIGDGGTLRISGAGIGSARISGNGRVYVTPSNNAVSIVRLTNDANSYTGATIFNGCNGVCSVYFSSIADLGIASSLGAPTTITDGTIIFNQSSQYTDNVIYTGDGDSSNRNWDLNGSGAVIRNQGTGTLNLTGDIDTNGGASFYAETGDISLLGVLSGVSFSFSASAGRTITLGNTNTFSGTAAIGGVVKVPTLADSGNASSLGTGTDITVNSGTLSYTGSGASSNRIWSINGPSSILNDGSGALSLSGDLTFSTATPNPDTLTLGGSFTGVNSFSGIISGNGNLTSTGSGTWVLNGANTQTGTVTVNGGTLRAGTAAAFGAATGYTVNGGTLDLNGFDLTAPAIGGTGGAITLGSATLTVNATTTQNYAGSITGSGGFTKSGAGTLTLTGASTYSGATTINGGKLSLDFTGAGGPASNIIATSSPLILSGGSLDVLGAASETNSQSFNGLTVSAGNNTVRAVSGTGGTMNLSLGNITRTGGLVNFVLPGTGAITTTHANGALGGWATINGSDYAKIVGGGIIAFDATDYTNKDDAGTWANADIISDTDGAANSPFVGTVSSDIYLGGLRYTAAAASTVTVGGGNTLGVDGTIIVAPSVLATNQTITGGSLTSGLGGGTLGLQHNGSGTFTIASTITDNTGPTSFAKSGAGTLVLSGANTYTGTTTLSDGILHVNSIGNGGGASNIGASTAASSNLVLEGGTLQYAGASATTDRGFTLVNGSPSRTIEVTNGAANLTFTGQVVSPDNAGLTKTGAGTLTLANAGSDYIGITTVSGGTLAVTSLANGGLASSIGAATSDAANIVLQTSGKLQYTGATTSIDRGFTLASGNGYIDVANASTTLTIGGTAVGAGKLVKDGDGTLVLTGANTYTGDTIVSAGTLRAGSAAAFGPNDNYMTVNSGATLELGGFNISVGALVGSGTVDLGTNTLTSAQGAGSFSGRITGSGGFTRGAGSYTQTLLGCNNDYTGATTVTSGLTVDCIADGNASSSIGASSASSANLVLDGGWFSYTGASVSTDRGFTSTSRGAYINVTEATTTLEFEGAAIGAGSLRKDGAGTLVLSGINTYTGGTQVTAGTLRAGSTQAFGVPGPMTLADTAGVRLELAGYDTSVSYLTGGGTTGGVVDLGGADLTITTGNNSASVNYGGVITGTGSLIKNGGATQRLSGCNNDYSGTTTINGGALEVTCLTDGGVASSIGSSSAAAASLILDGGTLRYAGAGGSTNRQFILGTGAGSALDASGTGAIAFTSSAPITFATPDTVQTLTLTGTNTGNNIFAGQITNNGTGATRLTKTGTGTWILTNPGSTYTGVTTISGGVLGVDKLANGGVASSLGASTAAAANLVIGNGSTLRYTGAGDSTNRLFTLSAGVTYIESSGAGAVVFTDTGPVTLAGNNQARTIALGGTNTGNNTLAGAIGNAGTGVTTLAKNDSGTWMLTGNHSYTGSTNVNGGILFIGDGGTTGSIVSATVNNFGALGFNRSNALTYAGNIVGTGSVRQDGAGTTTLTGTSNYSGGTTINAGTLQLGNNGTTGSIIGNVTNNGTFVFNRSNAYTFGGVISGSGVVSQIGSGTTVLTGTNSYAGGTRITGGTLQISANANLGNAAGAVTFNTGTLRTTASLASARAMTLTGAGTVLTDASTTFSLSGLISGAGSFTKAGAGALVLTADNSYTGGSTISAGTLQLGNGGTTGWINGNVADSGTLIFNRSDNKGFTGLISGAGGLVQNGSGITTLSANNSYGGTTVLNAGTLRINGDQSAATGLTTVNSGATLGGSGTIGGSVIVNNGGRLSPGNSPGTLTIDGNLSLTSGSVLDFEFGAANVVGGPLNDLIEVGGNLVLDGTINVTTSAGGTFGGGIYRVFNYDGTLTNNGLDLGTMPVGSNVTVQTSIAGQVNLINSAGLELSFWDGDAGPKFNDNVNGGSGTWHLGGTDNNWTDGSGTLNAAYADGTLAIFQGVGGTVTVDNGGGTVTASGMQFAADGYTITGDALTLVGPESTVRVGDGSAAGVGYTTTIAAELTGATRLVKTDAGTLVLTGANSYTGGTAINTGTLRIAADANLGDIAGGVTFNGGTLQTTADLTSGRNVTLTSAGTVLTDTGTTFTLDGTISGAGDLAKSGAGTFVLTANSSYTGGTTIDAGTLQLGAGGATGWIDSDVTNNGTLAFDRSDDVDFTALITGTGALLKLGNNVLTLTADNSYAGGTTIDAGMLQLGAGGATGWIDGDVTNNGTLAFNRSDDKEFAGLITGTGAVVKQGNGALTLTGANSYTGATNVDAGTLIINGDQSAANGLTSVATGAALGGAGTIGGDIVIANGASINPGLADATPGVLTINGGLSLAGGAMLNYDFGQADVVGGALNDLINVGGDLALGGTINVATSGGGTFGPGIYRVINYNGALSGPGLAIGTTPAGTDFYVQTSVDHQVNLINTNGLALRFWDGATGGRNDGAITGGDGIWQNTTGNDNWTLIDGSVNAPFLDNAFAIFQGIGGTVTVDNSLGAINVAGIQFGADGYTVTDGRIDLAGSQALVRVGDGTADGAGYTATIASELAGSAQLVKTDAGTLVLSGTNSYTGGTLLEGGTLAVAADANLGGAAGGLTFNGGALQTTADLTSARAVTLTGAGTILTDAGTSLTLSGALSGAGNLAKSGTGTLVLAGSGSNSGGMNVDAGTLLVNGNFGAVAGLTTVASGATLGGTGTLGGDVAIASGGTLAPGASAPGTLTIGGGLTLTSGSRLAFEFGEANTAGGALNDLVNVGGNLVLDGTIDVTVPTGGEFGPGVYRVFNYGGTLTDNGLALGTLPTGSGVTVQTSITGQVNLVNSAGLTLSFWDGTAGPKNNGIVNGGDGTWQTSTGNDNWTEVTGTVNAAYSDAAFATFAGVGGTVTVDNSLGTVRAAGMQFASNGYTITGDALTLTGGQSIVRVGDGSADDANFTATIAAALTGNSQLVKTDGGTLVLTGVNSYTGGTAIQGGTLAVSADGNLGDAAGGMTLNGGTLRTTADLASGRLVTLLGDGAIATDAGTTFTLNGTLAGAGVLTKSGTGTLVFTGDNSAYSATSRVTGGTLAIDGALGGTADVANGGRLEGIGSVAGIANTGVVAPGRSIGTLTVTGNYAGAGGTLEIETVLGNDSSATDRLVVNGATSGDTRITVLNRDGLGGLTAEGIKIIDIAGASDGTFTLNGDYVFQGEQAVIAGAYGYRLYKNGVTDPQDGDWYLRSSLLNPPVEPEEPGEPGQPNEPNPSNQPLYQPGVPVYEGYVQTLLSLSNLPTLQQRVGNRSWANAPTASGMGIWGRMEAARHRPQTVFSTSATDKNIDSWQMQMGVDTVLSQRKDGATLIGGLTAHYGKADASIASFFGNGSIDTQGYGVGATLTWYGPQGFYADGQAKFTWFDSDLKSGTLGALVKGNNGKGEAISLELGKRSPIGGKLTLTPQIQMTYAHVGFDRFADPAGASVSAARSDSLKTRWGLSVDHQNSWDNAGDTRRSHVYGLVNLGYEWLDGTRVNVSGTPVSSRDRRLWGELGIGGSYSWGNDRFVLYTEVSGDTPIADFGQGYNLKGTAGFRVRF